MGRLFVSDPSGVAKAPQDLGSKATGWSQSCLPRSSKSPQSRSMPEIVTRAPM